MISRRLLIPQRQALPGLIVIAVALIATWGQIAAGQPAGPPAAFTRIVPAIPPAQPPTPFARVSAQTGTGLEAQLASQYAFAPFTVQLNPYQLFVKTSGGGLYHGGFRVMIDMDSNGVWELNTFLETDAGSGTPTATWNYTPPAYPAMNDYVITWRVEERVVNAGGGFMYTRVAAGTTAISILAAPTDLYVQTAPPPGVTASSLVGYVSPDGVLDNPLVIVEGYDSSNHDFAPRFLGPLMEPGPGPPSFVWYLLTIGYDIYFYNFGDARLSMRDNALGMLGAIRRLNQEVVSPAYQTRVLAFSMGGVVARYALAWGEEYGYPHGCDMLVSADAPHQGAWLSLSFQTWLRGIEGSNATAAKIAAPLKTTAGKELLFANVFDIPIGQPPPPGGTPMAVDFRDELNGLNTNGYPHNTRNIALSNGKRIAGTSTIPGLGEYWWVGGIPIATLSVENNPVHVVYFAQPDIWGGSKQPAFKPQVINSYQSFWDGYFWVFPIHAAVGINFTIDLGSYGPPVFMDAPSALDLRGVTRTGFQAETITGWSSTGFDAIHSPTDNTYWHDQFPLATTVRDELLEKQEVFPPPLFANRTDLGVFWLWRSATSIDFALHSGGGPIVPGPTGVIPVRAVDQNYGYHAIPAVALAPGLSSVRLTYHYPGGGTVNRWSPPFTTWDIVESSIVCVPAFSCNSPTLSLQFSWDTTVATDMPDAVDVYKPGDVPGVHPPQTVTATSQGTHHVVWWHGVCQTGTYKFVPKSTKEYSGTVVSPGVKTRNVTQCASCPPPCNPPCELD